MLISNTGRTLPYSCEQLFDMAADIERYPEFLAGWRSARIIRRAGDTCYVHQQLALGPLQMQFDSEAVLLRPSRIDVSSSDARFKTCRCSLRVLAEESAGCRLSIEADLELSSGLLQTLLDQVQSMSLESVVTAFEARAHRLYAGSVRQRTEPPVGGR